MFNRFIVFLALLALLYAYNWVGKKNLSADSPYFLDTSESMSIEYNGSDAYEQLGISKVGLNDEAMGFDDGREYYANANIDFDAATLISDFQGYSAANLVGLIGDSTSERVLVVSGNINENRNVFVDTLYFEMDGSDFSKRRIKVLLRASEALVDGSFVIRLSKGGRQLSSVVRDPSNLSVVEFDVPVEETGVFKLEIDGDDIFYDNEFLFVLAPLRRSRVTIIDESSNLYLSELFSNSNLFEVSKYSPSTIDFEAVSSADVIVLNALGSVPSGLVQLLQEKIVIVFPSIDASNIDYQSFLGFGLSLSDNSSLFEIDVDYDHPLMSGVFEKVSFDNSLPSSVSLHSIEGLYETIISLRNGKPFLVKSSRGSKYLFNTSLNSSYTNIQSHSLFLPLMYQIALTTVKQTSSSFLYPGNKAFIRADNTEIAPILIGENVELIPEYVPRDGGVLIQIPSGLDPGSYLIVQGIDTVNIAVNLSKEESMMVGPTVESLQSVFVDVEHVSVQSLEEFQAKSNETRENLSLWKYALILILMFLLTETMLHRYIK